MNRDYNMFTASAHWDGLKFWVGWAAPLTRESPKGWAQLGNENIRLPLYERPVGCSDKFAPCRDQRSNSSRPAPSVALKSLTSITNRLSPIVDKPCASTVRVLPRPGRRKAQRG